jgi:ribonuclease BN (tRNA processing enzyme)
MARIIFLGTAGSSSVVSRNLRASGGIIIQLEDLQFHLDPGPGALSQAAKFGLNLRHNTAVLVSHRHLNHCNDLNMVVEAMSYSGIERRGVLIAPKSVVHNVEESHPFLTRFHQNFLEKIIVVEKKSKVGVDLVEINTLSTEHTDKTAVGFKFYFPKFVLSYTGDTAFSEELVEELAGTDILILNVAYPGKEGKGLNLDTDSAIKIISKVRPKIAVITHFGVEMLKADPIQEVRDIQRITGVQTIAAKDGMILAPESYNMGNISPVRGYN